MVDIKKILDGLNDVDRKALMYSFEHGLEFHVKIANGRFIGVNITTVPYLYPDIKVGEWSVGRIAEGQSAISPTA